MVPYVVGYFWLSDVVEGLGVYARPRVVRLYKSRLLAEIFRPAAMIESAVSPSQPQPIADRETEHAIWFLR